MGVYLKNNTYLLSEVLANSPQKYIKETVILFIIILTILIFYITIKNKYSIILRKNLIDSEKYNSDESLEKFYLYTAEQAKKKVREANIYISLYIIVLCFISLTGFYNYTTSKQDPINIISETIKDNNLKLEDNAKITTYFNSNTEKVDTIKINSNYYQKKGDKIIKIKNIKEKKVSEG